MGKIRRGNFIFVFWEGDHPPRHVHVYRDGKLIVKWDLEHDLAMKGQANEQILRYIQQLRDEGRL
jgi:hypothetical protein